VEADGDAEEGSPESHADGANDVMAGGCESCAKRKLEDAGDDQRNPVELAEPDVDWVLGEVGGVTAQESRLGVKSAAGEDPAGVGPPSAVVRSVGIAFLV